MKKPNLVRSLMVGASTVVMTGLLTSVALAAPAIAPGATPPAGTESWMTAPCTTCHTYTTPAPAPAPTPAPTPGGGTVTPPAPAPSPTPAPTRICGNCHADPGVGVTPPAEDHPFLTGRTPAPENDDKVAPKKHVKKHVAKKHTAKKAKRVVHED